MNKIKMISAIVVLALLFGASCEKHPKSEDHKQSGGETIRIATYNIRSNFGSDTQNWDTRLVSLDSLLGMYDFDIIGSQEPYQRQIDDLMDLYGDVYAYITVKTGSGSSEATSHNNPVFYKKDRFSLLDSGVFWFSETPEVPASVSWDASQPRNCVWVKLYDQENELPLYVFNSHFDHQSTIARNHSAQLLVARVDSIAGDNLAICTGDFNTNQTTNAFDTLSSGILVDTHVIAQQIVNDDYKTSHGYTVIPPAPGSYRIDHVLVSRAFHPRQVLLWKCCVENFSGNWASDHYPVFIDLDLN